MSAISTCIFHLATRDFVLTAVRVRVIEFIIVIVDRKVIVKVNLVPEDPADATEAFHKLTSLLRFVRNEFEGCSEILVLLGKPLE